MKNILTILFSLAVMSSYAQTPYDTYAPSNKKIPMLKLPETFYRAINVDTCDEIRFIEFDSEALTLAYLDKNDSVIKSVALKPNEVKWWSVDPQAQQRTGLSPYNFVQNNPINRTDPTGGLDGNFKDENGNLLGNDGIDDGKEYVIKTTQTSYSSNTTPPVTVPGNGISSSDAVAAKNYVSANSGNTDAFTNGNFDYGNFQEIIGDASVRSGMMNTILDNGKGSSVKAINNTEYCGVVTTTGQIVAGTGTTGKLSTGVQELQSNYPTGVVDPIRAYYHSHPSGSYTPLSEPGQANYGGSTMTTTYVQIPSATDIKNAGTAISYVFAMGSKENGGQTVYMYNNTGVIATLPLNSFTK